MIVLLGLISFTLIGCSSSNKESFEEVSNDQIIDTYDFEDDDVFDETEADDYEEYDDEDYDEESDEEY